jgi:hypothetical protein
MLIGIINRSACALILVVNICGTTECNSLDATMRQEIDAVIAATQKNIQQCALRRESEEAFQKGLRRERLLQDMSLTELRLANFLYQYGLDRELKSYQEFYLVV